MENFKLVNEDGRNFQSHCKYNDIRSHDRLSIINEDDGYTGRHTKVNARFDG